MKSLFAFMKKEILEQIRTGKIILLGLLFVLFGIMNPAIAKLTPWILESVADTMESSGMVITSVTITAMDSWTQFFKNIPIGLIAFVLIESSILTKEYSSGTLILSLTKGLERFKGVVTKATVLTVLWTICYWMCFGITYGYNAYFWDNSIAQNLVFSVAFWWVFGVMVVALMVVFSTLAKSNTGVLCGTGGVVFASYMLGMLPKCSKYMPSYLTDGNSLIYGLTDAEKYMPSLIIAAGLGVICLVISIPIFNKRHL